MRVCVDATIEGAGGNGPAPERGPARCPEETRSCQQNAFRRPVTSARASRHPRLTQRLNRRPPFSPRCVFPNLLRHLERQPDVLRTQKKKKWVPRSIAAPIFARSINYHVMPPSNHLAAPSAHTRAHRVRGVSARRRSPRVGDVVGIGAAAPPVPGGVLGVGTREAWLLRVPDFDDEI